MSRDPLAASTATALTVAWVAVAAVALLGRPAFQLSGWYPAKATAAFAVVIFLALRQVRRHHPFERFGAANQITTLRSALIALLAALVGEPVLPSIATGIVVVSASALSLDGVDGWIARRLGMASPFGARFDMEADAALILVLALLVWQHGKAGPWIVAAGLLRYAFVAAGWVLPWLRGPLTATVRGRAICVVQIAVLIGAMAPVVAPAISSAIAAAGLAALVWSFAIDTWRLWQHAAAARTQ